MRVVPVTMPVTAPEVPMVATEGVLLVQVPPAGRSVRLMVAAAQRADGPLIAPGSGFTVTLATEKQLVLVAIKVMGAVPAERPPTIPEEEPTEA
jgi:hypothetical protein